MQKIVQFDILLLKLFYSRKFAVYFKVNKIPKLCVNDYSWSLQITDGNQRQHTSAKSLSIFIPPMCTCTCFGMHHWLERGMTIKNIWIIFFCFTTDFPFDPCKWLWLYFHFFIFTWKKILLPTGASDRNTLLLSQRQSYLQQYSRE